jgi:quercetin dioxygenase-like cupin family protein
MENAMSNSKIILVCGVLAFSTLGAVPGRPEEVKSSQIDIHTDHGDTASAIQLMPNDIKYPPAVDGVMSVMMVGNRDKAGIYISRVKLLPGAKLKPHYHPDSRVTTVTSGSLYLNVGDNMDPNKAQRLPAGSFYYIPAKTPHSVFTKDEEVTYEETGFGPTESIPIK